jgi:hypothetical protein
MASIAKQGSISASTAVYTAPSGQVLRPTTLSLYTETSGGATVDIHVAQDGGAAAAANKKEQVELEQYETRPAASLCSALLLRRAARYTWILTATL